MGYFVMMLSLGMLVGPVVGAFVYGILGYAYTFYFFFVCLILSGFLA